MWRPIRIAAVVVGALLIVGVWASANSTFLYRHPRSPEARIVVDSVSGAAIVTGTRQAHARNSRERLTVAAPDATEFDFGTMDPLTMGQHSFVSRNRGTAPLKLEVGPTTCKCTVSGLANKEVPPGEFTTVTLEWNTGRHLHYAHAGTVYTNDPDRKSIDLRVQGVVRMLIGADRDQIVLDRIEPGQPTVVDTLLYSQLWDDFVLADLSTRIPGLQWETAAVDPDSARHLEAKAVQRLRITLPGDLPPGPFNDSLRLTLKPASGDVQPQFVDLPIQGAVSKPLAVYGPAIDDQGIIDLGTVLQGKGARVRLLIKLRDESMSLAAAGVEVSPPFLQATLTPHAGQTSQGLYDLTVELDDDAPACSYRTSPLGRVRIDTGHPQLGVIDLGVSFAVLPR